MRFCVALPCFFKNADLCESIKKVAALGYDAVEIYRWKDLDLDKVKSTLDQCGVEMLSMCTTEFNMTNPEFRTKWLDGLKESCEAAIRVGAKKLITQVGADTGEERAYQHEAIVTTLKQAKDILEDSGVTIMLEPLNILVDHKGYYLSSAYEGFDIIREVNHPNVKLIYDIYHQQITEGNIIPSVVQNLDLIAHLHSAGHPGRHELFFGENDYEYIFNEIDQAGYTGACGLEYMPLLPPEESLAKIKSKYKKRN